MAGSSGKASVLQAQGGNLKPHYQQKKKKKRLQDLVIHF
jgi:hypothetical protein